MEVYNLDVVTFQAENRNRPLHLAGRFSALVSGTAEPAVRNRNRSIPTIMEVYNLADVVTPSQLRSTVASEIRKNTHVNNPKIIDLLLFKGTEELNNIVEHSKQRHHILGQYVLNRQDISQDLGAKDQGSEFLKNFFKSNYF